MGIVIKSEREIQAMREAGGDCGHRAEGVKVTGGAGDED